MVSVMVEKDQLGDGFRVFPIPKAPRSARRKRKKDDCDYSAIQMLATLAGKILEESESSSSSNAINADDPIKRITPDLGETAEKKNGSESLERDSFLGRCSAVTSLSMRKKRLRHEAIGKAYNFSNKRNKNVVYRDDDENIAKTEKAPFKPRNIRLRRMSSSRNWKVSRSKHCSHFKTETWGRRKRRLFECDGGFSGESVSNFTEKVSPATFLGVHGNPSNVRLGISSIKIPDFFIDVPATATVASVKRIVVESMTNLIRKGLRVGMVHDGKKLREDDRTLSQSGITSESGIRSLSFSIEPTSPTTEEPLPFASPEPSKTPEHFPSKANPNKTDQSKAIILFPTEQPLVVAPRTQKIKRTEHVQRRVRRPFSVSEVESLVQAVEELGTGRWRDVKVKWFESAEHRTYVDLKDKWKTLVHTAKIAPQQRRGETVPQELLDRVLAAHSYWLRIQGRPLDKGSIVTLRLTDGH